MPPEGPGSIAAGRAPERPLRRHHLLWR